MSEPDDFLIVRPITVTDSILTSSVAETEAAWSSVTTYAIGNVVRRTVSSVHRRYVSLQNANTNKPPESEPTWWEDQGPTNRWKMFDGAIQSQTEDTDDITVEFVITGRVDSVALMNLQGQTVNIQVEDAIEGVIYDEDYSLASTEGINNWASYFRETIERIDKLFVFDLPPYANPTVTVTIEDAGETVKCGACIVGRSRRIGSTEAGARLGIVDFSVKAQNDFGDLEVIPRAYTDTGDFRVLIDNSDVDMVKRLLTSYRATPILYVGSPAFGSAAMYGFFRSFDIEIAYPAHALTSLSIESVT